MLYQTAGIEGMLHSDYLSNQIVEHFKQNNRVNNVDLMETILGDALIAMESVNFSESKGKNGGYLIMGRMLDDAFMSKMGRNLSLNLELTKAESPMKNSRQIEVEIIDENLLEATVNTYPISSGNIYRFSMIGERELYMDKKKDSVTYMLYLIAFGLFFMLILHVSLDRLIVSRIGKLAKNFGEQRSFSSRIQVDKGYLDEITNLQLSMNDVLDSLQKHRDKLAFQSQHHFLSNLPNRVSLQKYFNQMVSHSGVSLLFVNLDGIKRVNDSEGILLGDELIRLAAKRMHKFSLMHGGYIAHLTGDEFFILFEGRIIIL